jgi:phosphopantetheinyl transferase
MLTLQEEKVYTENPSKRKREWLLGRIAAKQILKDHIEREYDLKILQKDIEIISHQPGRPIFHLHLVKNIGHKLPDNIESEISLSIAHSKGYATASATTIIKEGVVGIDIEQIRCFDPETLIAFLTPHEYKLYKKQCNNLAQKKYSTLLWCLKESYLKAKGVGLAIHPQYIEIKYDLEYATWTIHERGCKIKTFIQWVIVHEQYIVTQVQIIETSPNHREKEENHEKRTNN